MRPWGSHITLPMMLPKKDDGRLSGRGIQGGKSREMLPSILCGKTFVWGPPDSPEGINYPQKGFCSIWCLHKGILTPVRNKLGSYRDEAKTLCPEPWVLHPAWSLISCVTLGKFLHLPGLVSLPLK